MNLKKLIYWQKRNVIAQILSVIWFNIILLQIKHVQNI